MILGEELGWIHLEVWQAAYRTGKVPVVESLCTIIMQLFGDEATPGAEVRWTCLHEIYKRKTNLKWLRWGRRSLSVVGRWRVYLQEILQPHVVRWGRPSLSHVGRWRLPSPKYVAMSGPTLKSCYDDMLGLQFTFTNILHSFFVECAFYV